MVLNGFSKSFLDFVGCSQVFSWMIIYDYALYTSLVVSLWFWLVWG